MRKPLLLIVLASIAVLVLASPAAALQPKSVPISKFQPAMACGCHAALLEQWSPSMHAQALTDPLYQVKLAEANKATDGAIGPYCNACHGPAAVMGGQLTGTDQSKLSGAGAESIGCDFCHQVVGTSQPLGNTSHIVKPDGVKRAQWADSVSPAHGTAASTFHTKAEFCGGCHNVDHPVNGMHLEATYTEWKEGPYSKEGIVCQDCHMTPGPGVTKPNPGKAAAMGPDREHIYTMTWVGGNSALGPKDLAEERLKAAATLDLTVPESGKGKVNVRVNNVGAGHMLPTGLTEFRQMWLEFTIVDAAGKQLANAKHEFGTILADDKGKSPVELWEAVKIQSDDRIPPKGFKDIPFEADIPEGPAKVTAVLYYRSASEEMAKKAGVEVPTTTMATAEKALGGYTQPDAGETEGGASDSQFLIYAGIGLAVILGIAVWALVSRQRKSAAKPE